MQQYKPVSGSAKTVGKPTHMSYKTVVLDYPGGGLTFKVELFGNVAHIAGLVKGSVSAVVLKQNGEELDVTFTLTPAAEAPQLEAPKGLARLGH
jgi:hypothetical protein